MITLGRITALTGGFTDVAHQMKASDGEFLMAITMMQAWLLSKSDAELRNLLVAVLTKDDHNERLESIADLVDVINAVEIAQQERIH